MNPPNMQWKPAVITAERPDSPDAIELIAELDAHLKPLYSAQSRHGYSVEKLLAQNVAFFLLRVGGRPAGCGGIELFGAGYGELKRMYVRPQFRGLGLGDLLVEHLTAYAVTQGIHIVRLETGILQPAAIRLYERHGFRRIPPFGEYVDDPKCLYYEKRVEHAARNAEERYQECVSDANAASQEFRSAATGFIIESMQPTDWDEVRGIYLDGLATGQASFETEAPSWEQWNEARLPKPRLVARANGRVIAWAALSPVSKRPCYAGVAETTIYVAADARGRGIGKAILQALIEESERDGIWSLYGATFGENTASIRMQLACGFRIVGRRERIAQHHGIWRDTIITERRSKTVGTDVPTQSE